MAVCCRHGVAWTKKSRMVARTYSSRWERGIKKEKGWGRGRSCKISMKASAHCNVEHIMLNNGLVGLLEISDTQVFKIAIHLGGQTYVCQQPHPSPFNDSWICCQVQLNCSISDCCPGGELTGCPKLFFCPLASLLVRYPRQAFRPFVAKNQVIAEPELRCSKTVNQVMNSTCDIHDLY